MKALLEAIRFLTILPVPASPDRDVMVPPGRAAAYFPLVGAALGLVGAALFIAADPLLPRSIVALLVVGLWALLSGLLHEDGLADVADAARAGRTQARTHEILKDPRIGTFGAVVLLLSVLARWQALALLDVGNGVPHLAAVLVASQAAPRAAMVGLAWISRPSGTGLGYRLAASLSSGAAVSALAQGIVAALLTGWRPALLIVAGAYLIVRLSREWFYRRIGGVNGDCLGFTEQLTEVFVLVLFTCRECGWQAGA